MNKFYRLVFSRSQGRLVAVAENAPDSAGNSQGSPRRKARRAKTAIAAAAALLSSMPSGGVYADGLPTGANITVGSGSFSRSGDTLTINQGSNRLGVNWDSFDIAQGKSVIINQPGAASVMLNRIISSNPTAIYGTLKANGQVFLVNPNGVLFGTGSSVDVGGLITTTRRISDADFAAGNYRFTGSGNDGATIINRGTIRAANGGYIALVGDHLVNSGTLSAPMGKVVLAAGDTVSFTIADGTLVSVAMDGDILEALIENQGLIAADGGEVRLTARGRNVLSQNVINNSGTVQAKAVHQRGGTIILDGGTKGNVISSGNLSVAGLGAGQRGGNITMTGQNVGLFDRAFVDARGDSGGGTVLIGGDTRGENPAVPNAEKTVMDQYVMIDASALRDGNGGRVVLWSEDYTGFYGNIVVRGGSLAGDGGFVETSSHDNLQAFGLGDASAPRGRAGEWLLDPTNVMIVSGADVNSTNTSGGSFTVTGTTANISNNTINTLLNGGTSVSITTSSVQGSQGTINVTADIVKTSGGNATLTLIANNSITIGANITSTAGSLNVALTRGSGTTLALNNANFQLNGGNLTSDATGTGANTAFNGTVTFNVGNATFTENNNAQVAPFTFANNTTVALQGGNLTLQACASSIGQALTGSAYLSLSNVSLLNSGSGTLLVNGTVPSTMSQGIVITNSVKTSGTVQFNITTRNATIGIQQSGSLTNLGGNLTINVTGGTTRTYFISNANITNQGTGKINYNLMAGNGTSDNVLGASGETVNLSAGSSDINLNYTANGATSTYFTTCGTIKLLSGNFTATLNNSCGSAGATLGAIQIVNGSVLNNSGNGSLTIQTANNTVVTTAGLVTTNFTSNGTVNLIARTTAPAASAVTFATHTGNITVLGGNLTVSSTASSSNVSAALSVNNGGTFNVAAGASLNMIGVATSSGTNSGVGLRLTGTNTNIFTGGGNITFTGQAPNALDASVGLNIAGNITVFQPNMTIVFNGSANTGSGLVFAQSMQLNGTNGAGSSVTFKGATNNTSTAPAVNMASAQNLTILGAINTTLAASSPNRSFLGNSTVGTFVNASNAGSYVFFATKNNVDVSNFSTASSGGAIVVGNIANMGFSAYDPTQTLIVRRATNGTQNYSGNLSIGGANQTGDINISNVTFNATAAGKTLSVIGAGNINFLNNAAITSTQANSTVIVSAGTGVAINTSQTNGNVTGGDVTFNLSSSYINLSGANSTVVLYSGNANTSNAAGNLTSRINGSSASYVKTYNVTAGSGAANRSVKLNLFYRVAPSVVINITDVTVGYVGAAYTGSDIAAILSTNSTFPGIDGDATVTLTGTLGFGVTNVALVGNNALHAGTYLLTNGTMTGAGGYNALLSGNASLIITPANLTITAGNQAKSYDGTTAANNSCFTASGLKGSDTVSSLTANYDGLHAGNHNITLSDVGFGGALAGDYAITYVNGTGTITPANLTITVGAGQSKVYDSTNAVLNGSYNITSGQLFGSDALGSLSLTYGSTHVGNSIAITASNPVFTNGSAGDYCVSVVNGSGNITKRDLTITALTQTKTYDATTLVGNASAFSLTGLQGSDSIGSVALVYNTTHAGNATLLVSGGAGLNGTQLGDYNLIYQNGTGTITAAALTITAGAVSRIYDGTTAIGNTTNFNQTGLRGNDTITGVTLAYGNASAGTQNVTASNAQFGNGALFSDYILTYANGSGTIDKANLTLTALAQTKVYDGNTAVTNASGFSSSGLVANQTIGGVVLAFDSKDAGGRSILISSANSSASFDVNNYNITYVSGTGTINRANLTLTAIIQNRTYDGSTEVANISGFTSNGLVANENISGVSLAYDSKNAGNRTILISNAAVGANTSLANYNITYVNGTGTIGAANLVLTALTQNRTYDGTVNVANASGFSASGLVANETIDSADLAYSSKDAGSRTITIGNATAGAGTNLSNYNISYANGTGTIDKANLTLTALMQSRTYDGTVNVANASAFNATGLVANEAIGGVSLTYDDRNAGSRNITISGAAAGANTSLSNYNVTYVNGIGTINQASLTLTALTQSRAYDGTVNVANASAFNTTGLVANEAIGGVTLAYDDKNAGNRNIIISGAAAGANTSLANYNITYVNGTGTINQASLTLTALTQSRAYDGTLNVANASGFSSSGLVATEAIGGVTLAYDNKNAGSRTITISGATAGANTSLSNYNISYANGTGTISAANLTLTALTQTRTYDGTVNVANASAFNATGLVSNESIGGVSLTYDNKNAGSRNITISDAAAGANTSLSNYNITYVSGVGTINQASLTLTALTQNRAYDGTTGVANASGFNTSGLVANESIGGVSLAYDNKNAGSRTITISGATAGANTSLSNYNISYVNGTGTIDQANLTLTALTQTRTYDGTVNVANVSAFNATGLAANEAISGVSLAYDDRNAGSRNITISGAAAGANTSLANYNITYVNGTGTINQASLTLTALTQNRTYDGTTSVANASGFNASGLVAGESIGGAALAYDNKNAGSRTITISSATAGANTSLSNYNITYANGAGTINQANLTLTALTQTKTYNGTTGVDNANGFNTSGLVANESLGGVTLAYDSAHAGSRNITISGATAGANTSLANYNITYVNGTGAINQANLTLTALTQNKTYNGTASVNNASGFSASGLVANESISGVTLAYDSKNAGNRTITIANAAAGAGTLLDDYNITYVNGTGTIDKATITAVTSLTADDRVYNGNANASLVLTNAVFSGKVTGDTLTVASANGSFADKNAGNNKQVNITGITLSGADASNYQLADNTATATANITKLNLTVSGVGASNKIYDGTANASIDTANAAFGGKITGDDLSVNIANATGSFADKNVGAAKTVNILGVALGGADADNYQLTGSSSTATANITAKALTLTALAQSKTYDGTAAANGTGFSTSGLVANESIGSATLSYDSKDAGSHTITANSAVAGANTSLSNYNITYVNGSGTINKANLTLTALTQTRTYDGTANVANISDFGTSGLVANEAIGGVTLAYDSKNAGSRTITISGATAGANTSLGNYNVTYVNGTGTINKANLTLTALTQTKVYDGAATANAAAFTGTGLVANETVSGVTLAYDSKNAGSRNISISNAVAGSGTDLGNYNVSYVNGTGTITKLNLTVSGMGASNKVYDGTANASVDITNAAFTGKIIGDDLSVDASNATGSFADKNVGTAKNVSILGVGLSGADAGNYQLTDSSSTATANITAKALTLAALTQNKTYDGSANVANVSGFNTSGLVANETIGGVTLAYDSKNAGNRTISISNAVGASGTDLSNYNITYTSGTGTIDKATISAVTGLTADDRVYDGTTNTTLGYGSATLLGKVTGDSLTVASANGSFADKNAGAGKQVNITGITLSGADVGNYLLASDTATTTATISKLNLTISGVSASNKVYDGTANASVDITNAAFTGKITGDDLSVDASGATGSFADKNVGTGKSVSILGVGLSGADASNYQLTGSSSTATANITAKALTLTAQTQNKTYDGTLNVANTGGFDKAGLVGNESISSATLTYDSKNAGNRTISISNAVGASGTDLSNYNITYTSGTGTIDKATIAAVTGLTADDRIYNGNTNATLVFSNAVLSGKVSGDSLTVASANGSFADKNAGTGKQVNITGITLSGADVGNYQLADNTATATAAITKLNLTVSGVSASNKVYDGTTNASVDITNAAFSGQVTGDDLSVDATNATGAFADKNVGTGKTVSILGVGLSGADAGNYQLTGSSSTATANITAKALTLTALTQTKTYDGTTAGNGAVFGNSGLAGNESISAATLTYDSKNAGNRTITISNAVAGSNTDLGNYNISYVNGTGTIDKATIAAVTGLTVDDRVYDGTTGATIGYGSAVLSGKVAGDSLFVASANGSFADKSAGSGKQVNITGITLSGADVGNYLLASDTATATASISKLNLTISGVTASNKEYDGTTAATIDTANAVFGGQIAGDDLSANIGGATGSFVDKNVGAGKTVSILGVALGGADAGNYQLTGSSSTATANITAKALTLTALTQTKIYDGTTAGNGTVFSNSGLVGNESISAATLTYDSKNAGNRTISISNAVAGSGTDLSNYDVSYVSGTGTIDKAVLILTALTQSKTYDGTTAANGTAFGNSGMVGNESVSSATLTYDSKNAGSRTISISNAVAGSGTDLSNYNVSYANGAGTIDKAGLTLTALTQTKTYDGTTAVSNAGAFGSSGLVSGESVSGVALAYDSKDAGSRTITISNASAGSNTDLSNYNISYANGAGTIDKAGLTLTALTQNKTYNGTTAVSNAGAFGSSGLVSGESVSGVTLAYDSKDAGTRTVTISNAVAGSNTDLSNYDISYTNGTGTIDKATLTLIALTQSKTYDGTTGVANANAFGSSGLISGETLSGATLAYDSKNAGNRNITISNAVAGSGTDLSNYNVSYTNGTGAIGQATISAVTGLTAADRVYDGTTSATLGYGSAILTGKVTGDNLSVTSATGSFADKNAGTGKQVNITGITLSGADAGNYQLADSTATATATISKLNLTIGGVIASDKVYDGGTSASINVTNATPNNTISGDNLTVDLSGAVGNFDNKNAAAGKTVFVTGLALGGTDAGNYQLTSTSALATADVNRATISSISGLTVSNKVYDGTTGASINSGSAVFSGALTGDSLTVGGTAAFADKNAGLGKAVSITGLALGGTDAGNYLLADTSASTTADIMKANLTITAGAQSKLYDGTTNVSDSGGYTVSGLVSGESIASVSLSYDSADVGTGNKTVTASNAVAGSDTLLSNYDIHYVSNSISSIRSATATVQQQAQQLLDQLANGGGQQQLNEALQQALQQGGTSAAEQLLQAILQAAQNGNPSQLPQIVQAIGTAVSTLGDPAQVAQLLLGLETAAGQATTTQAQVLQAVVGTVLVQAGATTQQELLKVALTAAQTAGGSAQSQMLLQALAQAVQASGADQTKQLVQTYVAVVTSLGTNSAAGQLVVQNTTAAANGNVDTASKQFLLTLVAAASGSGSGGATQQLLLASAVAASQTGSSALSADSIAANILIPQQVSAASAAMAQAGVMGTGSSFAPIGLSVTPNGMSPSNGSTFVPITALTIQPFYSQQIDNALNLFTNTTPLTPVSVSPFSAQAGGFVDGLSAVAIPGGLSLDGGTLSAIDITPAVSLDLAPSAGLNPVTANPSGGPVSLAPIEITPSRSLDTMVRGTQSDEDSLAPVGFVTVPPVSTDASDVVASAEDDDTEETQVIPL